MCVIIDMALSEKVENSKISATSIYSRIEFKTQQIRNVHGGVLGHEVLLSFDKLTSLETSYFFKKLIIDTYTTKVLVRKLNENIEQLKFLSNYIFINVERTHLCDNHLIGEIIKLNGSFKKYDVTLVIEVTERDYCGACPRIIDGILSLKSSNIMLAIDDYDIYKDVHVDFLYEDKIISLFDIIKINIPDERSVSTFKNFVSNCSQRVIVEMVETEAHLNYVKNRSDIWGIQGFIYDKGVRF